MAEGAFSRIIRALRGDTKAPPAAPKGGEGKGVKRRAQTDDEYLREKRKRERIARERAARLKMLGLSE